ncbi:hypothetical protein SH2C18_42600 [Clostridium sediminicola]|uniref:OadG family protein n=1 Tax=Clostridium sediminicola TaxID=3114879 RepID=UPI0031F1CCE0
MKGLDSMDFGQSLVVSGLGISTVILVLIVLALGIITVSKFLMMLGLGVEKKVASAVQSVSQRDNLDEESYAVLMAAACEEMKETPDKFRIVGIKEIH